MGWDRMSDVNAVIVCSVYIGRVHGETAMQSFDGGRSLVTPARARLPNSVN